MMTLADIDAATNSKDACLYSDLHKDVYGFRPRDVRFESVEAFDADFKNLCEKLDEQIAKEAVDQQNNFYEFVCVVNDMQKVMNNCTRERAIELIAEGEGIRKDQFDYLGLERILENRLNLKYGSIVKWLSE
jgi:hypothetical protein